MPATSKAQPVQDRDGPSMPKGFRPKGAGKPQSAGAKPAGESVTVKYPEGSKKTKAHPGADAATKEGSAAAAENPAPAKTYTVTLLKADTKKGYSRNGVTIRGATLTELFADYEKQVAIHGSLTPRDYQDLQMMLNDRCQEGSVDRAERQVAALMSQALGRVLPALAESAADPNKI